MRKTSHGCVRSEGEDEGEQVCSENLTSARETTYSATDGPANIFLTVQGRSILRVSSYVCAKPILLFRENQSRSCLFPWISFVSEFVKLAKQTNESNKKQNFALYNRNEIKDDKTQQMIYGC